MSLLFAGILLLFPVPSVYASIRNEVHASSTGGNSSVRVQVNNQVNTGNSTTTTTTTGKTNVEIHQTGDGTSSVSVDGKEWKLEGPGDISESVGSEESATPTPDGSPSATPTPTDSEQETQGFVEALKENLENFKEALQNLMSLFFGEK